MHKPANKVSTHTPLSTGLEAADAYLMYRRLLLDGLGYLASQGFSVQPADALDLIQGFFSDAWAGIRERYDPCQGRFDRYLYAAFVRFARRRIVQLRNWAPQLDDAREIAARATVAANGESTSPEELAAIRTAMTSLPPHEREILNEYLCAGSRSERIIARRLGISRFAVREALVNGVVRVAVMLNERGRIGAADWDVAIGLWRDARTPNEIAKASGRSAAEVRAARERIKKAFAATARAMHTLGRG